MKKGTTNLLWTGRNLTRRNLSAIRILRHGRVICLAFVLLNVFAAAFGVRGGEVEAIRSFLSNPKPIESYLYQIDGDETEGSLNVVRGRWAAESTNSANT